MASNSRQTNTPPDEVAQLRTRAEQGDAHAQFTLGAMYRSGSGVPQDFVQAVGWTRKAAKQGLASAQNNLGEMYACGTGIPNLLWWWRNIPSVVWYSKAAEQGNAEAQNNLGKVFATGRGVRRNYVRAVVWGRKAGKQGHL